MLGSIVGSDLILIDDLKPIIVNILFVNQGDVLRHVVIALHRLDKVLLYFSCFLYNAIFYIGNAI